MGKVATNANDEEGFFEEADDYYYQLAYGYIGKLLGNVNLQSGLAHKICAYIENEASYLSELRERFPYRKRTYKSRKSKAQKARVPLIHQRRELANQINALKNDEVSGEEKPDKDLTKTEQAKLNKLYKGLADIETKLSEIKVPRKYSPKYRSFETKDRSKLVTSRDWSYMKDWFAKREAIWGDEEPDQACKNLMQICDYLKLPQEDKRLLEIILTYNNHAGFKEFLDAISGGTQKGYNVLVGKMIGVSPARVASMMKPQGKLMINGIAYKDDRDSMPGIMASLLEIVSEDHITFDEICKILIGKPVTTDLDWDRDFQHLGADGDRIISFLKGAKSSDKAGLNILFYGLQDTGKTEAVKAACKKAGITLYAVGEDDDDMEELGREERLDRALLAQAMLADQKDAALLFDEMEDVLPQASIFGDDDDDDLGPKGGASKVFLNRLLENNKTLTFWTANDFDRFHPAVRRRMTSSLRFTIPPAHIRENLWKNISAKHAFQLAAEDCRELARAYKAPPGMIDTAVRFVSLSGGGRPDIEASLRSSSALVFGNRNALFEKHGLPTNYDIELLNATVEDEKFDINALTQDIVRGGNLDFSLLLDGPTGTGKTEYASYLAHMLNMEVLEKKASDLLGMYVGQNEQNIAAAFAEAEERGMMLVINEADTFLSKRTEHTRGWETSMVNEMLTQLESAKFPVVFSTNLKDQIDDAVKRRFVFKIKCDFLRTDQAHKAFEVFFGNQAPQSLSHLDSLTIGDFANVRRQLKFRRDKPDAEKLVTMLSGEMNARSGNKKRPFGFAAMASESHSGEDQSHRSQYVGPVDRPAAEGALVLKH